MSYVDRPSGWHLPGIAATATVHAVLLAVAALAFHSTEIPEGETAALRAVVFSLPATPEAAGRPSGARPPEEQGKRKAAPTDTSRQAKVAEPAPSATLPSDLHETEDFAARALPPPSVAPSTMAVPAEARSSSDSGPDILAAYAQQLRERILEWRPRGWRKEGTVIVAFSVDRAGHISKAELARSSGDVQMDRVALRMVRQAAPFPAPAQAIPSSKLAFTIPVRFH